MSRTAPKARGRAAEGPGRRQKQGPGRAKIRRRRNDVVAAVIAGAIGAVVIIGIRAKRGYEKSSRRSSGVEGTWIPMRDREIGDRRSGGKVIDK